METEQELIKHLLLEIVKEKPNIIKSDHSWLREKLFTQFNTKKEKDCSDCTKEINGLVMSLLWGIVDDIRNNYTRKLSIFEARIILIKLVRDFGQQEELSRWCIESWCIALNKEVDLKSIGKIASTQAINYLVPSKFNYGGDDLTHSEQTLCKFIYEAILKNRLDNDFIEAVYKKGNNLGLSSETIDALIDLAEHRALEDLREEDDDSIEGNIFEESKSLLKPSKVNTSVFSQNFGEEYDFRLSKNSKSLVRKNINIMITFFIILIVHVLFSIGLFNNPKVLLKEIQTSTTNINPPITNRVINSIKETKKIDTPKYDVNDLKDREAKGIKWKNDGGWTMYGHDSKHTSRSPFIGPKECSVKWVFKAESDINYSAPVIAVDGTIYFGCNDGNLYAVNPIGTLKWKFKTGDKTGTVKERFSDGSMNWKFNFDNGIYSTPAIGLDGTVYIGANDSNIYAINPDGSQKWSIDTDSRIYASPTIGADKIVYICASIGDKRCLVAINPTGLLKWSIEIGSSDSTPAIGSDGTIYIGGNNKILYAINSNGTLKWTFAVEDEIDWSSPAIADDGSVYIGCNDNNLYAIHPNGKKKWSYLTAGDINTSPAIAKDGTIYFRSNDRQMFALNKNGSLKWQYPSSSWGSASPTIGGDGTIYITGRDYYLEAVNPSGKKVWSKPDTKWLETTPSIGSDGTLYAILGDKFLYAIGPVKSK